MDGQEIVGFSESVTVTVKLQLVVNEAASVTVRLTVVTPILKLWVPGWLMPLSVVTPVVLHARFELLQLSPKTINGIATAALHAEASALTLIFEGQVTDGASSSVTDTVKLQLAVLAGAAPSETSTETVVTPVLKTAPSNVVLMVPVVAPESVKTIEATVQLSVAVTFHAVPLWV